MHSPEIRKQFEEIRDLCKRRFPVTVQILDGGDSFTCPECHGKLNSDYYGDKNFWIDYFNDNFPEKKYKPWSICPLCGLDFRENIEYWDSIIPERRAER